MEKGSQNVMEGGRVQETGEQKNGLVNAPIITLPKGGGAIKGIGEKFAANPVTGTGSMFVHIAQHWPFRLWPMILAPAIAHSGLTGLSRLLLLLVRPTKACRSIKTKASPMFLYFLISVQYIPFSVGYVIH